MCGILGVVALGESRFNRNNMVAMADAMHHRGPDGDGFFFASESETKPDIPQNRPNTLVWSQTSHREISLAHKRLSIVDLSNEAAQPMGLPDGSIWVVFNGEIYNHAEIRKELEELGHRFRTSHSDTEVILHAYQEWGIQCIERFRGMFAIGLWDQPKDLFYLVRDRIGIKPLYYTYQNGCCYFASEIKAILQDKSIPRKLNFQSAYDYLTFLAVPAPNTFFEGIQKLPAGHYIEIRNGQPSLPKEYWDVFTHVNYQPQVSEKEVTETLVEKLRESVKYRMMADVPVGVFLSGGIDSSVNAKLFSDLSNGQPVKAFSIGYENDQDLSSYTNEFYYARKVAKELGCEYHERALTQQDLIDFLPQLVHHQDEPIADPVCMPIYYVSKLARDNGVIVAQVGEGSDELFWGYRFWKDLLKIQEYNDLPIPNIFKKLGLNAMKLAGKDHTLPYELLRRGANNQPIFWTGLKAFGEDEKAKLIGGDWKKDLSNYSTYEQVAKIRKNFLERTPEPSHINWMSYMDLKIRLPELLLMRVDKMSMAVSLEARVPFLDHKFVEYSMGIPTALKRKNNESKYILKKAVEGLIPNEIIYRQKQGFDAPVYDWFKNDLGELTKKEIKNFIHQTGWLNSKEVEDIYQRGEGRKAWFLLNLALWWKEYLD